jgi:hypothetical protein
MNKSHTISAQFEARRAISKLLEHLARFAVDTGLSVADLNSILRIAAVKGIGSQQQEGGGRANVSSIAASTGIPRGEVSKILKTSDRLFDSAPIQLPTNKILAAWFEDPKFSAPSGGPADLRIFGRGPTFETLVKKYGRGIPPRAILEELARIGAIQVRDSQIVRLKSLIAIDRRMTPSRIKAFGSRGAKLLSSLLKAIRSPENSNSLFRQFRLHVSPGAVEECRSQIISLLGESGGFTKFRLSERSQLPNRMIVTVYIHQDSTKSKSKRVISVVRKNFRRSVKTR